MAKYTIANANIVSKILKNAFRATRMAMYSTVGDDHIADVRTQLNLLTNSNQATVAKAIIDIVKNDLSE